MIPIRCFTCGKLVGNLWEPYKQKLQQDKSANAALDELGLDRYCCRRMLISHLDLSDKFLMYNCSSHSNGTESSCSSPESIPMNIQQQMLGLQTRVSHPEQSK